MAIETEQDRKAALDLSHNPRGEQRSRLAALWRQAVAGSQDLGRLLKPLLALTNDFFVWLGDTMLWRYISSTLLRRIVVSNLLGLTVLLLGVLYLSQFNVWLIDAKRDSLFSQGRLIAGAIASNVSNESLAMRGRRGLDARDDNPFADLMFTLGPETVTPVLRRLLRGSANRARVYDRKGNLVADSIRKLPPGGFLTTDENGKIINRPKTKNLWTKLRQWFLGSEVSVYRELGDANGHLYPEVRTALKGKTEALLLLTRSGKQIVSVATPIRLAGEIQGVLLLSTPPGEVDAALAEERFGIFMLGLVALCAAMLASYLLARTVAGPMHELSEAAENVTRNIRAAENLPNFDSREDEVGQLARSFRSMTAALLRRIDASDKFAADVAHELKNPLTAARSTAEALSYAKTDAQRDQLVVEIQEEIKRLNKLITDVSNASRMDAELARHVPEPVDLAAVAQGICDTFSDIIADTGKRVHLHYDTVAAASGAYIVAGHEGRLGQVVTNLIDNALSFSPVAGHVDVRLRRDGPNIIVSVADQGPGIEPDKLETIFDRFYTYRPTATGSRGNNSGLGLSISSEIVRAHNGRIWAENRSAWSAKPERGENADATRTAGPGARFVISLPAADEEGRKTGRQRRNAPAT